MRAGRLDRRIALKKYSDNADAYANTWGATSSLVDAGKLDVWATKLDKSSAEVAEMGKDVSVTRTEFTTRWIDAALHSFEFRRFGTYAIVFEGMTYQVRGFEELGRREGMKFHTELRQ